MTNSIDCFNLLLFYDLISYDVCEKLLIIYNLFKLKTLKIFDFSITSISIINAVDLCLLNIFKFMDLDFVLNFYDMIEIEFFSHKIIIIKIKTFNWSLKRLVRSIFFFYHDFLLLDFETLSFKRNWKEKNINDRVTTRYLRMFYDDQMIFLMFIY